MEHTMEARVGRILKREQFQLTDIKYLTHAAQRTYFHLLDGREIMTSLPLKDVFSVLPQDDFWSIQKGIVVAIRHTLSIDDDNTYTMVDGQQFKGRSRNPAEHKRRRYLLRLPAEHISRLPAAASDVVSQCSLMDEAPIAFCLIELVFSPDGQGIDFVFRYCNREMENLEGMPVSDMVGRSFYEVFPNGDRKWIVSYADVAINGTSRTMHDFSPEVGRNLTIRCFQPRPGYCACLLTELEISEKDM